MRTIRPFQTLNGARAASAAIAALLLVTTAHAVQQKAEGQRERLQAMRAKGGAASLTVFPVGMFNGANRDVGHAIGLLLETEAGMERIEGATAAFIPPAGVVFDQVPTLFGEFIRAARIKTEYALYAEIVGTPATGAQEIRVVVVDKAGAVVWVDRQGPDDPDFKRIGPDEPMTCCLLVMERLRAALDLEQPSGKRAREGNMAKIWAEKSGLPDKAELDALETRQRAMKKAGVSRTLAVFPVQVDDQIDKQGAAQLAKAINDRNLCQSEPAADGPRFEIAPGSNEQRMLWDLARASRAYVRSNPPDADYALFAEYLGRVEDGKVWAVHFVVCDRAGEWVIVDFQNAHHADFKSVAPKSGEDCARLIVKRLAGYLR